MSPQLSSTSKVSTEKGGVITKLFDFNFIRTVLKPFHTLCWTWCQTIQKVLNKKGRSLGFRITSPLTQGASLSGLVSVVGPQWFHLLKYRVWKTSLWYGVIFINDTEGMLCLVAQSCLTLWDPMDCSPPVPSVHGILQARILEWVAMPSSRRSSRPKGINSRSPALQADSLPSEPPVKPTVSIVVLYLGLSSKCYLSWDWLYWFLGLLGACWLCLYTVFPISLVSHPQRKQWLNTANKYLQH